MRPFSHKKIIGTSLLFIAAFLVGHFFARTVEHFQTKSVTTSATGNWGLSFQEDGKPPVANATYEDLKQYDAYYAENTDQKVIYLTFDAGFENGNTPAILDALKKHNVPATFFVVGNFLSDNPDLIKRMVEEGHIVGNHTYTHPVQNFHDGKLFKGNSGCRKTLSGNHRKRNDKILSPSARKIQ